ncbi:MAG: hypothetical protein R3B84_20135 [Zavarzinella sp.]
MEPIDRTRIYELMNKYSFSGATLRSFRVQHRSKSQLNATLVISLLNKNRTKRYRLKIVFFNVVEFRFQKRPNSSLKRISDVRMAFFNEQFFMNLDPYEEIGLPTVADFRNSDAFLGSERAEYELEEILKK